MVANEPVAWQLLSARKLLAVIIISVICSHMWSDLAVISVWSAGGWSCVDKVRSRRLILTLDKLWQWGLLFSLVRSVVTRLLADITSKGAVGSLSRLFNGVQP